MRIPFRVVALKSPTMVPTGWFSAMVRAVVELRSVGGLLVYWKLRRKPWALVTPIKDPVISTRRTLIGSIIDKRSHHGQHGWN